MHKRGNPERLQLVKENRHFLMKEVEKARKHKRRLTDIQNRLQKITTEQMRIEYETAEQ